MYYVLILGSISLVIVLSYFGFRFIEVKAPHQITTRLRSFFYGYTSLVYALAAVSVSWMWVYYLNVYIGIPCLITGYLCVLRHRLLSSHSNLYKLFLVLLGIALLLAALSLIAFLNR